MPIARGRSRVSGSFAEYSVSGYLSSVTVWMAGWFPLFIGSAAIAADPPESLRLSEPVQVEPVGHELPTPEVFPSSETTARSGAQLPPAPAERERSVPTLVWISPAKSEKALEKPTSLRPAAQGRAIAQPTSLPLNGTASIPAKSSNGKAAKAEMAASVSPLSPPLPLAQVIDNELGTLEVQPVAPSPDGELGILQVTPPVSGQETELGVLEVQPPLDDPELGLLQISPSELIPQPRPWMTFGAYVAASSSDNVFLTQDPVQGQVGDNFVRPGLRWSIFPRLGPKTTLIAVVDASFLRYQTQSDASYDELRARVGVYHTFTNRIYGQLSFTNQWLFNEGFSDRFFKSHGVEWIVGRQDTLTPRLTLNTFYQGQVAVTDPDRFSNLLNSAGATLTYQFHPQWDTGLSYRFTLVDYTQDARHEAYQRLTGQLRYLLTPSTRITLFGGLSGGRSSEPNISFDDSFFGISIDATFSLF